MGKLSLRDVRERRAVAKAVIEPILTSKRDRTVAKIYDRCGPGEDGRSHTSLSLDTASDRLSSSESPLFRDSSTNHQNMPKKIAKLDPLYQVRDVLVPPKDMVWLAIDYSGAEAIGVAAYSRDWNYLDKLLAGEDTHKELAVHMFNAGSKDNVTPLQRDIAKTLKYASCYAASVPTLTKHLNQMADTTGIYMTQAEVAEKRNILLQVHPLERWWEETRQLLERQGGILWNTFGYRRRFHDPDEHGRLKDGLSFYPQSTVGWLMNENLKLAGQKSNDRAFVVLQVHDELLWAAYEDEVPKLLQWMKPYMERPFKIHDRKLYIPVEASIGNSWGSMKKLRLT